MVGRVEFVLTQQTGATRKARVDAPALEIWMGLAGAHCGMVGRVEFVLTQRTGATGKARVDAPALEIWMGLAGAHRAPVGSNDVATDARWADGFLECRCIDPAGN
jgi:hypothetical protein